MNENIKDQPTATVPHDLRKRQGQSLVEFAITLPIVLMLTFGVIEFSRLFQSWVSLQNAARSATRYATTGSFSHYDGWIDTSGNTDPNSIVPCVDEERRGSKTLLNPLEASNDNATNGYDTSAANSERIFATWYGGIDCEPSDETHQELRQDILRLVSIMEEARRGAGGLSIGGQSPIDYVTNEATLFYFLRSTWHPDFPHLSPTALGSPVTPADVEAGTASWELLRGYFDVMICSSRGFLEPETSKAAFPRVSTNTRFITILDDIAVNFPTDSLPETSSSLFAYYSGGFYAINNFVRPSISGLAPACVLNELREGDESGQVSNNPGRNDAGGTARRWLDAGGPGDRINIVVTYYHPLITPLGITDYVPIQARRSGVNETFRAARAASALLSTVDDPGVLEPPDDPEGTDNPNETEPPVIPSNTPLPTDIPDELTFDCARVDIYSALPVLYGSSTITVHINNQNPLDAKISQVLLNWGKADLYPTMAIRKIQVNDETMWEGQYYDPPTNNLSDPGGVFGRDFVVPANSVTAVKATYSNGPSEYTTVIAGSTLHGSQFTVINPTTGSPCPTILELNTTNYNPPNGPGNLPTTEVNCGSGSVGYSAPANPFHDFSVFQFIVENDRNTPTPISDFRIKWRDYFAHKRDTDILTLMRVLVGGSSAFDAEAVEVWRSDSTLGTGISGTVYTSGGVSAEVTVDDYVQGKRDGLWVDNYIMPPNSVRNVWLVFNGSDYLHSRRVYASDFNGSTISFLCYQGTGGNGGGSYGSGVDLPVDNINPPSNNNTDNVAPVAVNDTYATRIDQVLTVSAADGVLKNDHDNNDTTAGRVCNSSADNPPAVCYDSGGNFRNGDMPLTVDSNWTTSALGATVTLNKADGSLTYNASGVSSLQCQAVATTDTFRYKNKDARGAKSGDGTVTITLSPIPNANQRPSKNNDVTLTVTEGNTNIAGTPNLTSVFSDGNGHTVYVANAAVKEYTVTDATTGVSVVVRINSASGDWQVVSVGQSSSFYSTSTPLTMQINYEVDDRQSSCNTAIGKIILTVNGVGTAPNGNDSGFDTGVGND